MRSGVTGKKDIRKGRKGQRMEKWGPATVVRAAWKNGGQREDGNQEERGEWEPKENTSASGEQSQCSRQLPLWMAGAGSCDTGAGNGWQP